MSDQGRTGSRKRLPTSQADFRTAKRLLAGLAGHLCSTNNCSIPMQSGRVPRVT